MGSKNTAALAVWGVKDGEILDCIRQAWCKETAYDGTFDGSNPSRGQCAVTALLLHELYGWEVWDVMVGRTRHFFNVWEGRVIDLTAEQFQSEIPYETGRRREVGGLRKNGVLMERLDILRQNFARACGRDSSVGSVPSICPLTRA